MTRRVYLAIWAIALIATALMAGWALLVVTQFNLPLAAQLLLGVVPPLSLAAIGIWMAMPHD